MMNVLVFMTDQQRGTTVYGQHYARALTPRLDRFRQDGATFTQAFAPSPHCCPSRASLFTSRFPSEHGVWNNVNVPNALSRGPGEHVAFWSEDFARSGYRLGFSGKWHVSNWQSPADLAWEELLLHPPMPPEPGSLDRQHEIARRRQWEKLLSSPRPSAPSTRAPGEIIRPGWPAYTHFGIDEDPFRDAEVVRAGIDFVRGAAPAASHDKGGACDAPTPPWLLYVGTLGPHDPYTPPTYFLDIYDPDDMELPASFSDTMADKPTLYRRSRDPFDQLSEGEHREALRHYLAFCSYEDHLFGLLLDALEETGQADSTLVVYASDHGDYTGEHGLWAKGLPSFESAYHVPLIIRGPVVADSVRGSVSTAPVSLVDVGTTLLDVCGIDGAPATSGLSLAPLLRGESDQPPRDHLIFQSNGNEVYGIQRIVRTEQWKLVVNLFDDDELYDRVADPDEMVNLLARDSLERRLGVAPQSVVPRHLHGVVTGLYRKLWDFAREHDDDIMNPYILTALATVGPLDTL